MNLPPVSKLPIVEHVTAGHTVPASDSTSGVAIRVFVSGVYGASGLSTGTATFEPLAALPNVADGGVDISGRVVEEIIA